MNLIRLINVATAGWRTAVPPDERIDLLDQVDAWSREQRRSRGPMKLSVQGRRLIQSFEGLALTAYRDPPNPDPTKQLWSIGYGHQLGAGPQWAGKKITIAEAERLFDSDVATREAAVSWMAPTDVPHRFDAMVSLAYNIGTGEKAFPSSTVRRLHNAGDFAGAADAFRLWNKSGGAVNANLVARREKERTVYLNGYGQTFVPPGPTSPAAPAASSAGARTAGMFGIALVIVALAAARSFR
jgi:GH24 family phage-related lysozyme (muramidase)